MPSHRALALQFRQNGIGQLLAQLYTPLIEGIDIPDDPLYQHLVLI